MRLALPRAALLACGVLLLAGSWISAQPAFPDLTGRVVDAADLLSGEVEARIDETLQRHEAATGEQIVVATIPSLGGTTIEQYGVELGRHWGIGQADRSNGAVLIVAPAERQVRIEVGYGLEGRLTDARSHQIIESVILPAFRTGAFEAGIVAGVSEILSTLGGDAGAPPGEKSADTEEGQGISPILPILLFAAVVWLLNRGGGGGGSRRRRNAALGWGMLGGYYGGRGLGGGGFGGGGFGGGGGSFGGGGASGSW